MIPSWSREKTLGLKMDWIEVQKEAHHRMQGCIWVKTRAHIRDNTTGEVSIYDTDSIMENGNDIPNTYIWEEGNFCCDCNRKIFFYWKKELSEDETPCGERGYSVNLENPKTKKIYYREFT